MKNSSPRPLNSRVASVCAGIITASLSPITRALARTGFVLSLLGTLLASFSLQAKILDDFNDNIKTAWTDTANGGTIIEGGSVFTISSTALAGALASSKKTSDLFTNAAGHTI